MVDVSKLKYRLILLDESGNQYDLKDVVEDIGWEENESELAARISFTLMDAEGVMEEELCKNGRQVFLMAGFGEQDEEICRGTIKSRTNSYGLTDRKKNCTAYDILHQLDKSEDNRYIVSGRTTQQIFMEIAADWGIPLEYNGPEAVHGDMPLKNKTPAKMFLELLDDAKKKGAGEYMIRSDKGQARILPILSNQDVYVFGRNNAVQVSSQENIADMVTRVKVLGQSKGEQSAPVEAVVDGKTEFGILQKIYQRDSDETIEAAKQASEEILKEDGVPKEETSLSLPDVPYVRKGDMIYCDCLETADGYYQVLSVSHDCDARTMSVKIKKLAAAPDQEGEQQPASYTVGSQVTFLGGTHYVSSDAGARGYTVKGSGLAKITKVAEGKGHPYHLIHSDSSCNVYGWVDAGTFA